MPNARLAEARPRRWVNGRGAPRCAHAARRRAACPRRVRGHDVASGGRVVTRPGGSTSSTQTGSSSPPATGAPITVRRCTQAWSRTPRGNGGRLLLPRSRWARRPSSSAVGSRHPPPGLRQSRGMHPMSEYACRRNLPSDLDQRRHVALARDVGLGRIGRIATLTEPWVLGCDRLDRPPVTHRLDHEAASAATGDLQDAASPDPKALHRDLREVTGPGQLEVAPTVLGKALAAE